MLLKLRAYVRLTFPLLPLEHSTRPPRGHHWHRYPAREASILALLLWPWLQTLSSSIKNDLPSATKTLSATPTRPACSGFQDSPPYPAPHGHGSSINRLSQLLHFKFLKCTWWPHHAAAGTGSFLCNLSVQSLTAPIFSLLGMCQRLMGQWFPPRSHLAQGHWWI